MKTNGSKKLNGSNGDKYAHYAATDYVRVRLVPEVIKPKVAVFYRNGKLVDDPRTKKFIKSLPDTIEPLPDITAATIAIVGMVVKNSKRGYTFLAEEILLSGNKKPFEDAVAQQLLWARKFYTPLFIQRFQVCMNMIPPTEVKRRIDAEKKFLLDRFSGTIKIKSVSAKQA